MISDSGRHSDAPLALADALFGPEPSDEQHGPLAALGKAWGRIGTGRGTVLEVRIGWLAGVQYLQFFEVAPDTDKCTASILVSAAALSEVAACMTALVRYEGG